MQTSAVCSCMHAVNSLVCYLLGMSTDEIVAWATVFLAVTSLVTVCILIAQTRITRLQSRVAILMKYTDEFDSSFMKDARKKACSALRGNADLADTDDILDFFEEIALLVRQKAIEPIFVWHSFFYWMHRYYILCENYIKTVRNDPKERSRWEDFVWLYNILLKMDKNKNHCTYDDLKLSQKELEKFLDEEIY